MGKKKSTKTEGAKSHEVVTLAQLEDAVRKVVNHCATLDFGATSGIKFGTRIEEGHLDFTLFLDNESPLLLCRCLTSVRMKSEHVSTGTWLVNQINQNLKSGCFILDSDGDLQFYNTSVICGDNIDTVVEELIGRTAASCAGWMEVFAFVQFGNMSAEEAYQQHYDNLSQQQLD